MAGRRRTAARAFGAWSGVVTVPRSGWRRNVGGCLAACVVTCLQAQPAAAGALASAALAPTVAEQDLAAARNRFEKALREGTPSEVLVARHLHGRALARTRDSAAALRVLHEALEEARKLGDQWVETYVLSSIGVAYQEMPDFSTAIDYHRQAIALGERIGADVPLLAAFTALSWAYGRVGEPEQGLAMARKALDLAQRQNDSVNAYRACLAMGQHQNTLKQHEAARVSAELGLFHLGDDRARQVRMHGLLTNLLGFALEGLGRHEEAVARHREAKAYFESFGDLEVIMFAGAGAGAALYSLGRLDEARRELESVLPHESSDQRLRAERMVLAALAQVEEAAGNPARALELRRRELGVRDRMERQLDQQRIAEVEVRMRSSQIERELEELRRAKEREALQAERERARQRAIITAFTAGLASMSALVALLVYRRRAGRRLLLETESARARAEAADALKTRLLGIAAHDLRSPLTAMVGAAALLKDDVSRDAVAETAGWIETEGERLLAFIQNLLDASALELGGMKLARVPLDLGGVVRASVEAHRVAAAAKGQRIDVDVSPAIVVGDAQRLRQVVDNLVSNALKFSPRASVTRVALESSGTTLRLAVSDQGPGLTAEDRARLFRPFERLSARPTGQENSTGLGLSIVHELVLRHGGTVEVDTAPGKGATFVITLPLAGAAAQAAARAAA